jgi:pimeloyl-ACP methyl ester carboxylesterase
MPWPDQARPNTAIETADSQEERPLFFSTPQGPLYGAFHYAQAAFGHNQVLVFCHSLGVEHMMTQRMEALGARAAVKAGFAAFRYDSRGHGDSTGDPKDVTFGDLVDDACAAADHARTLSGATSIIWVGVRFGCLIAAAAMDRRNDAAALAMWEPLHEGGEYFRFAIRTMLFCQVAQGRRSGTTVDDQLKRLEADGVLPAVGTYLYRALWRSASDANLERSLEKWGGDTLVAQVQRRPTLSTSNHRLKSDIEQRGGKVTAALISQEPSWSMLPLVRPQWTNEVLLAVTRDWLHGLE